MGSPVCIYVKTDAALKAYSELVLLFLVFIRTKNPSKHLPFSNQQ